MTLDDEPCTASADGILHCLRLLAEEAATLNLHRTLMAIEDALEAVALESHAIRKAADERAVLH